MLQLLETFCAVAEAGSLNKATEHLHFTQPAITRQLKALERELGAVLLTRSAQGVSLTPIGVSVLEHARQALAQVRACRNIASDAAAGQAGHLRLAAGLMVTQYVLPPVVARFQVLYPDIAVELHPGHHREALDRLLAYEVDACVIASPVSSPEVRAIPIVSDPLMLVSAPGVFRDSEAAGAGGTTGTSGITGAGGTTEAAGTAVPARTTVSGAPERRANTLSGIQQHLLLVLPTGTGLHEQITSALARAGISCRLAEYPTAETIKTMVALRVGITILPLSAVRHEVQSGTLRASAITDWPEATRVVRLLIRATGRLTAPVAAFVPLLEEHYRQ